MSNIIILLVIGFIFGYGLAWARKEVKFNKFVEHYRDVIDKQALKEIHSNKDLK